jgi:ferrous iron transport protein B
VLTNLISQGIIPGIGGILIFIPQIAFLFMFISILEESGYMSRVVFLMDKIMRNLVYRAKCGAAYFWNCLCYSCYNAKETSKTGRTTDNNFSNSFHDLFRSACLRNYYALVIPDELVWFLNMQGMTLMLLYFGLEWQFSLIF